MLLQGCDAVKTIYLYSNATKDPSFVYTLQTANLLLEAGFSVIASEEIAARHPQIQSMPTEALYTRADAMVVLGGDGTILRIAPQAARYGLPVLAVNTGHLGYIAQMEKGNLSRIASMLDGSAPLEERTMLSVSLIRAGEKIFSHRLVLNDAVIAKKVGHGVIETKLYCDNDLIGTYRGDGILASSATGSTAYAMSAGGIVLDPTLSVIEIVPICAHSLKARPIVFSQDHEIALVSMAENGTTCVTLDGDETTPLLYGDRILIRVAPTPLRLLSVPGGFGRILYRKMSDL